MKRIHLLFCLITFISTTLYAQTKQRVVVGTIGIEVTDQRALNALVDEFQEALIYGGGERYEVRNGQDEFDNFIKDEYAIQSTGYIADSQLASIGNALGAQYICGIVVEYNKIDKDFYFRAKIVSVETDEVKHTARYPNEIEGDLHVEELSRFNLQKVALLLIKRLDILSKEGNDKLDERIGQMSNKEASLINDKNRKNNKARTQATISGLYNDFLNPYSGYGCFIGYDGVGFQFGVDYELKYLHIGFGGGLTYFAEFPVGLYDNYTDTYSDSFRSVPINISCSIGINTKYLGVSISPHFFFNDKEDSKYKKLTAITKEVYINIPIDPRGYSAFDGIRLGIGYTTVPEIDYDAGFSFRIGFFDCF